MEKEEVAGNQTEEVSNLFKTISVIEEFESITTEESMNKQKVNALVVVHKAATGEDYDHQDENDVKNMSSVEVHEKIQQRQELRTTYRGKWVRGTAWANLWGAACCKWQEKTIITEELHNESKHDEKWYKTQQVNKGHLRRGQRRGLKIFCSRS